MYGLLPGVMSDTKTWMQNGFRHRGGDKPAVISADGSKQWWVEGRMHRDGDKPALISDFVIAWMVQNKLHRDGNKPAVLLPTGEHQWWFHSGYLRSTATEFHDDSLRLAFVVNICKPEMNVP